MTRYLIFQSLPMHFLVSLARIDLKNADLTIIADPNWKIPYMWAQIIKQEYGANLVAMDEVDLDKPYDFILLNFVTPDERRDAFVLSFKEKGTKIVKIIHGIADFYESSPSLNLVDEIWTIFEIPLAYGRFFCGEKLIKTENIPAKPFINILESFSSALNLDALNIFPQERSVLLLHQNLGDVLMSSEAEYQLFYQVVKRLVLSQYTVFWKSHYQAGNDLFLRLKLEFGDSLQLVNIPKGIPLELFYKDLQNFNEVVGLFSTAMWTLRDIFHMKVYNIIPDDFLQGVVSTKNLLWNDITVVSLFSKVAFDPFFVHQSQDKKMLHIIDIVWYLLRGKQLIQNTEYYTLCANSKNYLKEIEILETKYQNIQEDYNELTKNYDTLEDNHEGLSSSYHVLEEHINNLEYNYQILQENYKNIQQNPWYRFGLMSRKHKIWTLGKVVSRKLHVYRIVKPIAKGLRKLIFHK